jgi:hypothetical protein
MSFASECYKTGGTIPKYFWVLGVGAGFGEPSRGIGHIGTIEQIDKQWEKERLGREGIAWASFKAQGGLVQGRHLAGITLELTYARHVHNPCAGRVAFCDVIGE